MTSDLEERFSDAMRILSGLETEEKRAFDAHIKTSHRVSSQVQVVNNLGLHVQEENLPAFKAFVKQEAPKAIAAFKKIKGGRERHYNHDVRFGLVGFGCIGLDVIQNDATDDFIAVGIVSDVYRGGHQIRPIEDTKLSMRKALKELGYKPRFGWDYVGGFRFVLEGEKAK